MQNLPNEIPMQELLRLAKSPAGQQLIQLLQTKDPGQLQQAVMQAQSGNYQQAKESLSSILGSEDVREILEKMGG